MFLKISVLAFLIKENMGFDSQQNLPESVPYTKQTNGQANRLLIKILEYLGNSNIPKHCRKGHLFTAAVPCMSCGRRSILTEASIIIHPPQTVGVHVTQNKLCEITEVKVEVTVLYQRKCVSTLLPVQNACRFAPSVIFKCYQIRPKLRYLGKHKVYLPFNF